MKRSSKSRELAMETAVGTLVFAALLSLSFFTILLSGEALFKKTYSIEIVFDDVMGLREGDNVVTRGMPVGKVKNLVMEQDGVHVTASIRHPLKLREDYKIEVVLSSVLGGRYLQIYEGSAEAADLHSDKELVGHSPRDLIAEATGLIADLQQVADKINRGEGTIGMLINDDTLYNDARDVVSDIKSSMRDSGLLENVERSAANLSDITAKINSGEGTIGKLINDNTLYADASEIVGEIKSSVKERGLLENIEESASNLKDITAKVNSGEGMLGKLVNDDELYEETKSVLRGARATLNDLRETAPIVTFTSIFFGVF